jgi:hypothetical protein
VGPFVGPFGEVDRDRRPSPGAAVDPDVAAALLYGAVHARHPQPGPLANRLRGEEGLEDAPQRRGIHPFSYVADDDPHVAAGLNRNAAVLPAVLVVHLDRRRCEHQPTASRHGSAGVECQVDEDLLQLSPVSVHLPLGRSE